MDYEPRTDTDGWDLEAVDIVKRYGKVTALNGASLRARFGEVHALLGENGAGKSTLCKIVTGSVSPDAGTLRIGGETIGANSVTTALEHGVGTVFQELSLLPDLSVAENMFMAGAPPRSAIKLVDHRAARHRTAEIFEELGIEGIDPRVPTGSLALSQQQLVEIAKVVARKPRILILDEATSSLPRQDVLWLFEIVKRMRTEGCAVLVISHRLNEAFELADRVTVFRNGADGRTGLIGDFDESSLVEAMLGRELEHEADIRPPDPGSEIRLEVRDLAVRNRLRETTLSVRRGEIFGLAGLQGQGQNALLRALYGSARHTGEILVDGAEVSVRSPRRAIRSGLALVPEDRRTQGLALEMSIRDNLTLPSLRRLLRLNTLIAPSREEAFAEHLARQFSLTAGSLEDDVASLSGGNQQKVLLAKVLSLDAKVLLFSDVTRGVDVGTKADIFALMRELAARGTSIVFYSSDSTELIHMCHRVAVMFDRGVSCVLEGTEITERNLVQAAVSGRLATTEAAA